MAGARLKHMDETGFRISGETQCLHIASPATLTFYRVCAKRGSLSANVVGTVMHDHWKPYFNYGKIHVLCNAHHLRELTRAWEQDGQQWAKHMHELFLEINTAVDNAGGCLDPPSAELYRQRYRDLLTEAETECPPPKKNLKHLKRGRVASSKSRNLLARLKDFEDDVLRFMDNKLVPFSNNQAENDLRMIKLQQKVTAFIR